MAIMLCEQDGDEQDRVFGAIETLRLRPRSW